MPQPSLVILGYALTWVAARLRASMVTLGVVAILPAVGAPAPPDMPVLTNVSEVINLAWTEAKLGYPVRLRATITYYRPGWQLLFLQDATGGLYVFPELERFAVAAGDLVGLNGTTGLGALGPVVMRPTFEYFGPGEPSKARNPTVVELAMGCCDAQWVQVEAVVQRVERGEEGDLLASLGTYLHPVRVIIPAPTNRPSPALEDARIRVTGVSAVATDHRALPTVVNLYVARWSDLEILESPPEHALAAPFRQIRSLHSTDAKDHRVRVKGTVSHPLDSRAFYLEDASGGILVEPCDPEPLVVGESLEVLGFFAGTYGAPRLQAASLRRSWSLGRLVPRALNPTEELESPLQGSLVTLEAEVLQQDSKPERDTLLCRRTGGLFMAEFTPPPGSLRLPRVASASSVRLTGVCALDPNPRGAAPRVLLRSTTDLSILRRFGWWTPGRAMVVVAVVLIVMLLALGWWTVLRLSQAGPALRHRSDAGLEGLHEVRSRPGRVFIESLCARSLVEDVLRLNEAVFLRQGVLVTQDFDDVPLVAGDRSMILLILLDLVTNALLALSRSAHRHPELTIRIRNLTDSFVEIALTDNGAGIAAKNVGQIFDSELSDSRGGPSFSLERAASSAREIGASLTASSEGPGRGATFTLLLPLSDAPEAGLAIGR